MKTQITIMLIIAIITVSCGNKKTGEELVKQYILDSVFSDKREIYDIQILPLDSCYSSVTDDPSYQNKIDELIEHREKIEHEIKDYQYEVNMLKGKGVNKGLINLYIEFIREDIKELKAMQKVYKSHYKGLIGRFHAKYKTNFSDSLLWGYGYTNQDGSEFKPTLIITGDPITTPTDSLFHIMEGDIIDAVVRDTIYYKQYRINRL